MSFSQAGGLPDDLDDIRVIDSKVAGDPSAVPAGPAADMSAGGDTPVPGADALGGEDPLDTSF
ncbi:MAG: hypothetical protein EOO77_45385, partial [Oxalobacteraceae bacterium]